MDQHAVMAEPSGPWVVITGGGSGIGRGLVHHFCQQGPVLTCGRRLESLAETLNAAPKAQAVTVVACDIASAEGRQRLLEAIPSEASVRLLVQNAAIGDPATFDNLDLKHFEEALKVNLVAPMALMQAFLPHLRRGNGRVLHLGTSVAHHPQKGTATYGITKAAFHRLYQQLNAEGLGVPVATLSPGLVDTEGVRDHVAKARRLELPHVNFFDAAFEKGWTTDIAQLMAFVEHMLACNDSDFTAKEWRFSEWRKQVEESAL